MPKHAVATENRRRTRTVVAASFGVAALALTGAGVYAGLTAQATNTTAEIVSSGTLLLTMAPETGAAALSATVSNLAPGDVDNRYVVVTNSGTLVGKSLGLAVSDGTVPPSVLSTSATKGLSVSISACSIAWVPATGVCAGTTTSYLAKTSVSALGTRVNFTGPIAPAAAAAYSLRISTYMDGTETVTNGTLPGDTAQGLTATLTYTFSEDQRDGVTTNS